MGTSTDAILAYGYNLGGDDGWELRDADQYGEINLDWYDPDDDDTDFATEAMKRLRAASADAGIKVEMHQHHEFKQWLLAAHVITANRGDVVTLQLPELAALVAAGGFDGRLARAVEALGVTPLQAKPEWLLVSYWG